MTLKDEVLARLADRANVAQFASFGPSEALPLRHARIRGRPRRQSAPAADVVAELLAAAAQHTVNVRTFRADAAPGRARGTPFHYGLATVDEVLALLRRHASDGYHTIVNETVAVDDGGVSGVALGGLVEFAPDDTPRCVDQPGTAALPHAAAMELLATVYGFRPDLPGEAACRVEFSIHPTRVGLRATHTLVWEQEEVPDATAATRPLAWPNRFSRMLGDKTFGLLVALVHGFRVPRTVVVNRRVAPFVFGAPTGTAEHWLRTAPAEAVPGRHPTTFGWRDPFALLAGCEPAAEVASVLAQEAVDAAFSGAALASAEGVRVEGVAGRGDDLMLGHRAPERLPADVASEVRRLARALVGLVGDLRLEWAHDGARVWVLQLQQLAASLDPVVVVAGDAPAWRVFEVTAGLDALRAEIAAAARAGEGIVLRGAVGITSHFGDLLRRANVPSRLDPSA